MSTTDVTSRPTTKHRLGVRTEALESRRLLAATPNLASALSFAIGLPIASLETGAYLPVPAESTWEIADQTTQELVSMDLAFAPGQPQPGIGLATPAQPFQTSQASISLPMIESTYGASAGGLSAFGPSASGPSTTLNPLGYGTETANAAASEVVHAIPGRSDRISTITRTRPIIPLPHYDPPGPLPFLGPEIQERPPAQPAQPPAKPDQPPTEKNAVPDHPIDARPAPAPKEAPAKPKDQEPMSFQTWDAAIDLVEADLPEVSAAVPTSHAEAFVAVGGLLAAWGGWNYRSSLEGRSRHRPQTDEFQEAGPDDGVGR